MKFSVAVLPLVALVQVASGARKVKRQRDRLAKALCQGQCYAAFSTPWKTRCAFVQDPWDGKRPDHPCAGCTECKVRRQISTTKGDIGPWVLVFRQTSPAVFVANEWSRNPGDPTNDNYAILDQLEAFRLNGKFEFKLAWPSLEDQIWKQTSNPVTKQSLGVEGYEAISVPYTSGYWAGLENNLGSYALLDGAVDDLNWFYAIGAFYLSAGGYPAGFGQYPDSVALYVRGTHEQARLGSSSSSATMVLEEEEEATEKDAEESFSSIAKHVQAQ